ncbi:MAG: DoxX family protein [Pseudomonadota bacterium]
MTDSQLRLAATAGRAVMALLFFIAGIRKLVAYGGTLGYFASLGVPLPEVTLPLTIAVELGGGLAFVLGWQLRFVAPLLALFTLGAAMSAHRFWEFDGPQYAAQLNNFFKNVTIAGAFALVAVSALRAPQDRPR